jgi:hypothetical protein
VFSVPRGLNGPVMVMLPIAGSKRRALGMGGETAPGRFLPAPPSASRT